MVSQKEEALCDLEKILSIQKEKLKLKKKDKVFGFLSEKCQAQGTHVLVQKERTGFRKQRNSQIKNTI